MKKGIIQNVYHLTLFVDCADHGVGSSKLLQNPVNCSSIHMVRNPTRLIFINAATRTSQHNTTLMGAATN
jgi:hypothetical protein